MSGYILCQTKRAELPYFIENISMNIYSIEELCYYLYHNLYLVDTSVINEDLCVWIQMELELPALASKLHAKLGGAVCTEEILYPIFKEINYLTYEELKSLNVRLQKLNAEPEAIRDKQKADALMENDMYVHAIQVYRELLEKGNLEEFREGLTECVYHNLGCAYSYLFQMEKALDCFRRAYEGSRSRVSLEAYLIVFGLTRTPGEYEKMAKSLGAEKEVLQNIRDRLKAFSQIPEIPIDEKNMDAVLNRLTREYHRSTGS
ncbi:hypothetical protein [Blautia sp. MSJ-19]|uniref:hypothetical protein n=1 Tax=Blautia sp. MSJ-19 TaxID=2841517 RepID=UPI002ED46300